MDHSRSLDTVTKQFMSNHEMSQLPSHEQKYILNHFKKLYSNQMSKTLIEINRLSKVTENKTKIQQFLIDSQQLTHQNLIKKMKSHNENRQKQHEKKNKELKTIEDSWKQKMAQIQKNKKQQLKKQLQKANQYRLATENYWKQNNNKKENCSLSIDDKNTKSRNYLCVKTQEDEANRQKPSLTEIPQHCLVKKVKSLSNPQFVKSTRKILPIIQNHNNNIHNKNNPIIRKQIHNVNNPNSNKHIKSQSENKLNPNNSLSLLTNVHIEKSRNIHQKRQEQALRKMMEKMKKIQQKRKQCQWKRHQQIKQLKQKHTVRLINSKSKSKEKSSRQYNGQKSPIKQNTKQTIKQTNQSNEQHSNRLSLEESIVRHRQAKQEIEEQQFTHRGEMFMLNTIKQKRGKMFRLAKQTIAKMRKQALNSQ